MKKYTILLCLAIIMLASCTTNQSKVEATHFPILKNSGGLWGFVDENGKVVVEDEFRNQPSLVIDGMFLVKTSDRSNLLSAFSISNPTNPVVEGLKDITFFTNGLAPCVKEDEGIKYIDKQGNVKFELPLEYIYAKKFENGYSMIAKKEKGEFFWDAINTKGEILKFSEYSLLFPLRNGEFLADQGNSGNYCIIDNKGKVKTELKGVDNYYFENFAYRNYPNADADLMKVLFKYETDNTLSQDYNYYIFNDLDKETGFIGDGVKNVDGTVLIKCKESVDLWFLNNGKIKFRNEDEEYGIEDIKGEVLIRPKYKSIEPFGKNEYIVSKASDNGWKYGVINQKEERILGFDYDDIEALSNNTLLALVHDFDIINGNVYKYQVITTKGKVLGEYTEVISSTSDFRCERNYNCVKSDYFDVADCVKSLLYPNNGIEKTIDNLYNYAGLSPSDCAMLMKMNLTKDDILQNTWLPSVELSTTDYGTISYRLGFSGGVVETYYDEDDYWQFYPRYTYANKRCDCICICLDLNEETRSHKDQIEKQIGDVLVGLGYLKAETPSLEGKTMYSNSKVSIEVSTDYNLILEAHTIK